MMMLRNFTMQLPHSVVQAAALPFTCVPAAATTFIDFSPSLLLHSVHFADQSGQSLCTFPHLLGQNAALNS